MEKQTEQQLPFNEPTENKAVLVTAESTEIFQTETSIYATPTSFAYAQRVAQMLMVSNLIPAKYQNNLPNTMIALEMATRMKISPLMVMQNLDVVQGKPSWSSTFIISMINSSGRFSELEWEVTKDANGVRSAYAFAYRKSDGKKVEGTTVTMEMAQAEGWLTKNGSKWKTMPEQMIRYRSATFFARLHCPELLNGIMTTDEVHDASMNEKQSFDQRQLAANAAMSAFKKS